MIKDSELRTLTTVTEAGRDEEKYGYKLLRIRRDVLIEVLSEEARKRGVGIRYEARFERVVADNDDRLVVFEFQDGTRGGAGLLVGADGLRSRIRKFVTSPNDTKTPSSATPEYVGQALFAWSVPRARLREAGGSGSADFFSENEDEEQVAMMIKTAAGPVLVVPDDENTLRFGITLPLAERDVAGWKALQGDKGAQMEILMQNHSRYPKLVRVALDANVPPSSSTTGDKGPEQTSIFVWPYYRLSVTSDHGWVSASRRVALIGDAAHAMPPIGGMGGNMALEDAWVFAREIAAGGGRGGVEEYERKRKERVKLVQEWSEMEGKRRGQPVQVLTEQEKMKNKEEEEARRALILGWRGE